MPTPPRPIDYTLTRGHAARLRPNPWRRLVAVVGSAHDGLTRPLAMGLTALGLVGVLIASAPTILQPAADNGGSTASSQTVGVSQPIGNAAPAPGAADTAGGGAAAGAALASGAAPVAEASSEPGRAAATAPPFGAVAPVVPQASGAPIADGAGKGAAAGPIGTPPSDATSATVLSQTGSSAGVNALLVVSMAFLVVGLGLFLLRWGARRLTDR